LKGAYVADLILDNCQVPRTALLATDKDCLDLLAFSRIYGSIGIATLGAGIIDACRELSIERAVTQKRGGKKLGKFQEVHFKIAEMQTSFDAVLQIALRAAYALDAGEDASVLAAAANVQAAESATKAADDAMSIFGGAGYISGSVIERYWRDARFLKVAGEPIEVTRRRIADTELAKYK